MTAAVLQPQAPSIRLFSPDSLAQVSPPAPPHRPNERTIYDGFEQLVLPDLHDRSPDTVQEYRLHLGRLAEFCASRREAPELILTGGKDRMLYPGLAEIDKPLLLGFRSWLLGLKTKTGKQQLSNRSANKHLGSVLAVLRACVDEGWAERVPRIRRLSESAGNNKHYLDYDQLSGLYRACAFAAWPTGLWHSATRYWRCAIVWWFNYGFRTQELIRYEGRMHCLHWRDIHWGERSPAEDGKASNPYGWLTYVPQKQRRYKPEPLTLPLNATTYAHLKSIEPPGGGNADDPIFPFPLSSDSFATAWDGICLSAGIRPAELPKVRIKHLRKTCETWHDTHYRWKIGEYITGHAARTVSEKHYSHLENNLLEAIHGLPQPDAFAEEVASDVESKRPYLLSRPQSVVSKQLKLF